MTSEDHPDVIFRYTLDQAIADGVLEHPYPKRFPYLLITDTVSGMIDQVCEADNRQREHVLLPLMHDCVMQFRAKPDSLVVLEHTAVGKVWISPNDRGGLTIMKPEDY